MSDTSNPDEERPEAGEELTILLPAHFDSPVI
jgi:hypothetical protein